MPLIQFPSSLLVAVSVTILPAISEATAVNNNKQIRSATSQSIFYTLLISIGVASVFAIFPYEIGNIIYNKKDLGDTLFKLAFICPLLYLQITLSGILNGIGEHIFIFKNNIISSIINIFFIYFFIPKYGIDAFIIGWFLSLLFTTTESIIKVSKKVNIKIKIKEWIIYPLLCILASALIVRFISLYIERTNITMLLLICLMMLMYILFSILLGILDLKELLGIKNNSKR